MRRSSRRRHDVSYYENEVDDDLHMNQANIVPDGKSQENVTPDEGLRPAYPMGIPMQIDDEAGSIPNGPKKVEVIIDSESGSDVHIIEDRVDTYTYPDPEFHDFDKDREESCFSADQLRGQRSKSHQGPLAASAQTSSSSTGKGTEQSFRIFFSNSLSQNPETGRTHRSASTANPSDSRVFADISDDHRDSHLLAVRTALLFREMMSEDGKIRIEKFDGQDFGWWKMQVEDLLCQKHLPPCLTGQKHEKMKDEEWADLDRKALAVIRCTLTKSVAFNIMKETTARGVMTTLSNMYEKPSASNKLISNLMMRDTVESWIMDSGASFHAISSSRKMKNLRQGNFGTVSLANNQTLDITGVGDIDLKTNLGTIWTLKDVRVIPKLRKMLISIVQLDDQGYNVHFGEGQWKVVKGRAEKQGAKLVPEPVSEQETETIVDTVPEFEVGGNDESEVASESGSSESEDEQSPFDHTDQWVRRSTRVTKKPDSFRHLFSTSLSERLFQSLRSMMKLVSHELCAHRGNTTRPFLFAQMSAFFHSGQTRYSPRSFFGVEDFADDDNSRPYTYQKGKKSKNPHKHVSFKQRTGPFIEPFTLDVFISARYVSASITHRVTCKQVAVAGTNSKDIKAMLKSRCDIPACLAVGRILADRAREADVYTTAYTPRDSDKFEGKVRAVVQSLIDSGIDVKVYLD
ncbi:unnamed protein product [Cuscuta campestris]|uniref:Retrovirus-related Pol polyprotein from transposon TNT 1-94-like beta-barrel domain-containing protein n=2 Tax=Cuscuta sect. Cleistogrammica TaxID=1824901 RepID=A0A484MFZ5_9ASTE|nr:unnamed protein product [Cuscuta campestris]